MALGPGREERGDGVLLVVHLRVAAREPGAALAGVRVGRADLPVQSDGSIRLVARALGVRGRSG